MTTDKEELKQKIVFLFDVLKRYDHYIGTSNFKVGLMMSFLATIILSLSVRILLLNSDGVNPSCIYYISILSTLSTIICSLFASIQLFRVVFPNTDNQSTHRSLIFYGDVSNCNNGSKEYFEAIKDIKLDDILQDIATQTYTVAEITNEKFRLLKFAINIIYFTVIPLLTISLILLIIQGIK